MTEENKYGKREAYGKGNSLKRAWGKHCSWVNGLTRKQRILYRLLFGVAVVVTLIAVVLGIWIRVPDLPTIPGANGEETSGDVSFQGAEVPNVALSGRKKGVYTFLVVGKDIVSGSTDTMLLLSYDTKEKTIQGINLPRDTMVNVSTTSKRLNAVYNYNKGKDKATQVENGMTALKKQVSKLTGIVPDFYVIVEWDAVGALVDAVDGVEFDVPFNMNYDDPYQDLHIHQTAGLRTLNGDDAMQVIRWRKNNTGPSGGDVARLAIQQDFLKAVAKKCLQPSTFLKIPSLVKIFKENVNTDLTVGNILAFAQMAYGMDAENGVTLATAPLADSFSYHKASLVTLDAEKILEVINGKMNPYLRDIEMSDLEILVHQSNGSFKVTSGTLADERMGQATSGSTSGESTSKSTKPSESTKPEQTVPDQSTKPSEEVTPPDDTTTDEETPTENPDAGQNGGSSSIPGTEIDPGEIFPDPNEKPSQDIETGTSSGVTTAAA